MLSYVLGMCLCGTTAPAVFSDPASHDVSCLFNGAPAIADFNRDGCNDVAMVNVFLPILDGSFVLYLGDGKGGYRKGPRTPVLGTTSGITLATCIAAGDFNGDRRMDAVLGDGMGRLWIFPGQGDGTFGLPVHAGGGFVKQYYLDSAHWQHLSVHDFDGDGTDEVVGQCTVYGFTTGLVHQPLTVYRHAGRFKLKPWVTTRLGRVRALATGDLDRDGVDDFVASADQAFDLGPAQADLYFVLVNGGGARTYGPYIVGGNPITLDTLPGPGSVEVLLGCEDGSCRTMQVTSTTCFSNQGLVCGPSRNRLVNQARFADLDGDGVTEVVTVGVDATANGRVTIHYRDAGGGFRAGQSVQVEGLYTKPGERLLESSALADMNHDGNPDLVVLSAKDSKTRFNVLSNLTPFRCGYRQVYTGQECAALRVVPTHPDIRPGNTRFGLRVVGGQGGWLVWNFVRWENPIPIYAGMGLYVAPRLVIPMDEELHLPIPYDKRFTSLDRHYFQWISARGDRISPTLVLCFP